MKEFDSVEKYKKQLLKDFKKSPVFINAISILQKPFEENGIKYQIEVTLKRL